MTDPPPPFDERDLTRRVLAAYFRSGGFDQPTGGSVVQQFDGKLYVVLSNVRGSLAVYRVRNDGMLKRLHQPPRGLAPDWYELTSCQTAKRFTNVPMTSLIGRKSTAGEYNSAAPMIDTSRTTDN